ncbi:hypothetical protein M8C13_05140 [Crossiella sp. SN42]|uniref:hypothetical protein n=1 Tax=Crossiella sp. SN42 TaxID=2944808 RepID=UPI00207CDED8|nr:hypothetical protein [Crossiella sp. SN42]MCO1575143.1 hypothetical protein [Crossiella sp. SN42]
MREFDFSWAHAYDRTDNVSAFSDALVRAQWRLKILVPFPERWGVLVGDVLTNLCAALDHTLWTAVLTHSGMSARPHRITFPLTTARKNFKGWDGS